MELPVPPEHAETVRAPRTRPHALNLMLLIVTAGLLPLSSRAGEGYAYGKNHCYHFSAPPGWAMDNAAGKEQGIPVVFYPQDSSWADAPTAIYTRQAEFVAGAVDEKQKIQGQVERALTKLRSANDSPDSKATFVRAIDAQGGAHGELWKFTGDKYGNNELVAYFVGRATLNYFVMSSRDPGDFERSIPSLLSLAESYREDEDCKPCAAKQASGGCVVKEPVPAPPPVPPKKSGKP